MTRFVITAPASWERDVEVGDRTQHSMPEFSAELQQMAVAMLMAPIADRPLTPR